VCLGLKTARRKRSQLCLYSPQKFNSAFGKFTYFFLSDLKFSCVYSAVFAIFLDVIRYSYLSIRPALSLWLLDRLAWNERSTRKTSVFERKPYLNANNVRTQDILFVNLQLKTKTISININDEIRFLESAIYRKLFSDIIQNELVHSFWLVINSAHFEWIKLMRCSRRFYKEGVVTFERQLYSFDNSHHVYILTYFSYILYILLQ
jgi:hypothetical protein